MSKKKEEHAEEEALSGEEIREDAENSSKENDKNPGDELLRRLNEAEETAKEMKEKYFRVLADLENYRRRAAKEREELRDYAISTVIEDLLPAMDNLRLGLEAAKQSEAAKSIADGFRMVADQLIKTLEGYGLEEHNPTGKTFDPNLHDCMSHQPDADTEEGVVLQTIRPGYRLKSRLIRPAYVIVSSGAPENAEDQDQEQEEAADKT